MVGKDIRLKRPQSTCKGENSDSCEHTGVADQMCGEDMQLCYKKMESVFQKMEEKVNTTVLRRVVQKKKKAKSTCYNTER